MRIEFAGAQITDAVVETLENLQTNTDTAAMYADILNQLGRMLVESSDGTPEGDAAALARLRVLQMIRDDLARLACPPDLDTPANDVPTASF